MEQRVSNVSLEANNLKVVILPEATKLKGEWFFLFRQTIAGLPDTLPPLQRVILLDIISLGSVSPESLICVNTSTLLEHGVGRTNVYRALNALRERGLVAGPKSMMVYLNPQVAYRGKSSNWGSAMAYWIQLGGKYEE